MSGSPADVDGGVGDPAAEAVDDGTNVEDEQTPALPTAPTPPALPAAKEALQLNVRRALEALPAHFETVVRVAGIPLPDLFTLNSSLGAAIERATVAVLNDLRSIWDPDNDYLGYQFVRYSESFPDVRLQRTHDGKVKTALGIELKGWFILSKEGEPSSRYTVSPFCCADVDLLCIVPWYLDGAISGAPQVLTPYVESARYMADIRNYWWQHLRRATSDRTIKAPPAEFATPYPKDKKQSNDEPTNDKGRNFGRLPRIQTTARVGILDEYIAVAMETELAGVKASRWRQFLLAVSESKDEFEIERKLKALLSQPAVDHPGEITERILGALADN